MTKTATAATLDVLSFNALREVYEDDWQSVVEMMNYIVCQRQQMHVSLACGPDGWNTNSKRTLGLSFPAASGWNERLRFRIVVPPETQNIRFGARCFFSGDETQAGQIRVTCGAAGPSSFSTFDDDNNTAYDTLTFATSSTGTGELDVIVEINHTLGSATDCYIRDFWCEEVVNTVTSLPDPADT